jgi:RHS repeat-associated protein
MSGDALNRYFGYDPIYRLLSATGRECDQPPDGPPWQDQPRCTDLTKARAYTERYTYDRMGNMLRLEHRNEPGGFTRAFTVEAANNRLRALQVGQSNYDYAFDANGNMRSESTSRHFEWNHSDQMKTFRTQTAGAEPSVHAHYLYDAGGQRVKKLVRKQGGQIDVTHYIDGAFEHHRWDGATQAGENNHLHVMDDKQRIALVRIGTAHPNDGGPATQFHLGDHLGSSNVVVDSSGAPVNREEFTPYGETGFGSFTKKRYRFTGKERDEESGLSYHGARYYAAWLGKWGSVDPEYLRFPAWSPFSYSFDNPLRFGDPTGREPAPDEFNPGFKGSGPNWEPIHVTADMPQTDQNYTSEGAERYSKFYKDKVQNLTSKLAELQSDRDELTKAIGELKTLHFESTRETWPNWGTLKTAASVGGVIAACYASAGGCLLAITVEGYGVVDKKNGDAVKVGAMLYGCSKGVNPDCAMGVVTQVVEWGAGAQQKSVDDKTKPVAERIKLKIAEASVKRDLFDLRIKEVQRDIKYNNLVSEVWKEWAEFRRTPQQVCPYMSIYENQNGKLTAVNVLVHYWNRTSGPHSEPSYAPGPNCALSKAM